MNLRHLLAGALGGLMSLSLSAAPDPRKQDLELEEKISRAQNECVKAGETYQDWMNGRIPSSQAGPFVQSCLANVTVYQKAATQLAAPSSQSSVRHWALMQQQELGYFFSHIRTKSGQPRTQAQLQQSWQNAVAIQADLLTLRDSQLGVVAKTTAPSQVKAYYRWKQSMLQVLRAELRLAQDVAQAFQQHNQAAALTQKGIKLHAQAAAIQPPPSCAKAHQLYLERFAKLVQLCGSAQSAIAAPDADTVANLQEDEEIYRKKALASDDASLAVLRSLLSKIR